MIVSRRVFVLAGVAVLVPAVVWGPDTYARTRPLADQIAAQGGAWQQINGHRVVTHRIPQYCYSPGIGAIAGLDSSSAEDVLMAAVGIATSLRQEAEANGDMYITVAVEFGRGRHWPWHQPDRYRYAWHFDGRTGDWRFFSYAGPPTGRPLATDSLTLKRAGQYSIRINDQYRVCFRWEDRYADDVEVTDYHQGIYREALGGAAATNASPAYPSGRDAA